MPNSNFLNKQHERALNLMHNNFYCGKAHFISDKGQTLKTEDTWHQEAYEVEFWQSIQSMIIRFCIQYPGWLLFGIHSRIYTWWFSFMTTREKKTIHTDYDMIWYGDGVAMKTGPQWINRCRRKLHNDDRKETTKLLLWIKNPFFLFIQVGSFDGISIFFQLD